VFGHVGRKGAYRGRVRLDDFRLQSGETEIMGIPQLHQPHEQAYLRDGAARGRKFYFHGAHVQPGEVRVQAVRVGGLFTGRLYFEDLSPPEAGMLFFAAGLDGSFAWKLGYGKPAYMGSIRPLVRRHEFLTQRYGVALGAAANPTDLARQYAETGMGWYGVPAAVASLRQVLSPEVQGPAWQVNPRGGGGAGY
jgi:hypothetical protein